MNNKILYMSAIAVSIGGITFAAYLMKKKRKNLFRHLTALDNETWKYVGEVKDIVIHPVKSCAGISLASCYADITGLVHGCFKDRTFLLVDEKENFITGRKYHSMVTIKPEMDIKGRSIILNHKDKTSLRMSLDKLEASDAPLKTGRVFSYTVQGVDCGDEASMWIGSIIGKSNCRLLYHAAPKTERRTVTVDKFPLMLPTDTAYYADLGGYMLMTTASIEQVESLTGKTHHPKNFRSNILLKTTTPFDEDKWTYLKLGQCVFRNVKPCQRCIFTTVDHDSGKRDPDMEPLRTLRKTRMFDGEACLGINLGVDLPGILSVGDPAYALYD